MFSVPVCHVTNTQTRVCPITGSQSTTFCNWKLVIGYLRHSHTDHVPFKVPVRSNFPKFMFVDFSKVYAAVTYHAKLFFNPSTRSPFFSHGISRILCPPHSRPQSLRSFWPAAGIERLWEQPFQACAIDEDFVKPDGQNSVISFVISKWLLPELLIPAAGQKDRRLWGRECVRY